MIDPLEAVIRYLGTDADLNALTGGRIAAKHRFGSGWEIPCKAVQLRLDGGAPELYVARQAVRLEARLYGESPYEAGRVYRQLVAITRGTARARVETGDGYALVDYLLMASGPSALLDPDAKVDTILVFLQASVAEQDIP